MTHVEEYEQFLRECGPVLEEMARRLGSWEAVGEKIGRDCGSHLGADKITPSPSDASS